MHVKPQNIVCWVSCLFFGLSQTDLSAQHQKGSDTSSSVETSLPAASSSPSGSVSGGSSLLRKGDPVKQGSMVRIGPGDELDISVFGQPELSQHGRVDSSGDVSLPLVRNLHLAGLSSEEAQSLIERRLADGHYVNNPQVFVYVKEYTTEGISLTGEVSRPGVYSPLEAHRLLDLIQKAGGLTEKAGRTVTLLHRDDQNDPTTLTFSNDVAKTAKNNLELLPGDTVVVSKAGIVYVVGEVNRPGGFVIQDNKITASQVLAMAAGPTHTAALDGTKVIRHTPEGLKDIPLPLKKILRAKTPDVELLADDIVWVPNSKSKSLASSSTGTILGLLGTLAIYRLP